MHMSYDGRISSVTRRRWVLFIRKVRMLEFNYGLKGGQDLGRSGDRGNIQHEKLLWGASHPLLPAALPLFPGTSMG